MLTSELISAFLTLTFLEIVLGIDNIIFISILADRFPKQERKKLMRIGLLLAMFTRIALLFGVSVLVKMRQPFWTFETSHFSSAISVEALILFLGGLFLIYKSTHEIFQKVEAKVEESVLEEKPKKPLRVLNALFQIVIIDIVFSFDSILTAVGMTNGISHAFGVMVSAVIVSIILMITFAGVINSFMNQHPSLQVLGLSFLLLIGFMLIAEGAHQSNTLIFGNSIGTIPKGYLYFAIAFSLG
ncbi:MAG: TerC family protein, partial [Flavobacteriaceae bacterium]